MAREFLEFERPLAEMDARIHELKHTTEVTNINIADEIDRLQQKSEALAEQIFAKLTPAQVVKVARHPERPHTVDYLQGLFTEFDPLHGDRHTADHPTITGGLARLDGLPVMVLGQEKGREVEDKVACNFGMPRPEDYRKACRLMQMAERFGLPVLTFIDTPGAYPGVGAEERNQSEAIARNLFVMAQLKTPIVCTVVGEGGSGGALALGMGDVVNILQFSTYSVISPEGCASILWKTAERAEDAATALGLTADALKTQGLVDHVVPEPIGGAHRSPSTMMATLKAHLVQQVTSLQALPTDDLLERRYQRLMLRDVLNNS